MNKIKSIIDIARRNVSRTVNNEPIVSIPVIMIMILIIYALIWTQEKFSKRKENQIRIIEEDDEPIDIETLSKLGISLFWCWFNVIIDIIHYLLFCDFSIEFQIIYTINHIVPKVSVNWESFLLKSHFTCFKIIYC